MAYERKNIQAMAGYTSGEQPDSADIIKLNTNENPFPPGPAVAQALNSINVSSLRRYPAPTASNLQHAIACHHKVDSDNVIVTNGGDELLRLAISTFVESNESIAVAEPSYSLYSVLASAYGCKMLTFELNADWSLPDNYASKLNAAKVKLCFVVNPQAPSGQLILAAELRQLAQDFNGVLFIDEAYVDFVDPQLKHDCVSLIEDLNNVLILRTFSKGYSLAGLRMAYGLGAKSIIDPMQYKTKDSFNTDFIAQRLAQAAIEDQAYADKSWTFVRSQRTHLSQALTALGFSVLPSQSNFMLVTPQLPFSAENIYLELKAQGVLVRYFNINGLKDKLRITVGNLDENQRLIESLKRIMDNK